MSLDILHPYDVQKTKAAAVSDYKDIKKAAEGMLDILDEGIVRHGQTVGAVALSHCQVSRNASAFFVVSRDYKQFTENRRIIVNAKITDQRNIVDFVEGCLSFDRPHWKTKRFRNIEVEYQYPKSDDTLKFPQKVKLEGISAIIFQHEIDHANGENIYDKFKEYNLKD